MNMKNINIKEQRVGAVRDQSLQEIESFMYMLINSYTIITRDKELRKYAEKFIDRINRISPLKALEEEDIIGEYTIYIVKE